MQRSCDRCKGDGREGDGRGVANGHMTVGGRGRGGGAGGRGRRGRGGREEEREGGPAGPPLWARQARHSGSIRPVIPGPVRPRHLGPSGPPSIKPVGWPRALKKIKFRPGPAR